MESERADYWHQILVQDGIWLKCLRWLFEQ